MSKLSADNLRAMTAGIETPMQYPVRGSAKAWVNWNGSGTVAIRDSLNTSSITDLGTGSYRENYTTAFANANYGAVAGNGGAAGDTIITLTSHATGTVEVTTMRASTTLVDPTAITVEALGTLA